MKPNQLKNKNPKSWYKIENSVNASTKTDEVEIYIYDDISYFGFDSSDLLAEIRDLDTDNIKVHLGTHGGDVFEGLKIMNTLRKHKAFVTIEVDAMAASAGSIIGMAADRLVMLEGGQLLIHNPWTVAAGEAKDFRHQADILDKLADSLAEIYANRTDKPKEFWAELMEAETMFNGTESVEIGLADEAVGHKKKEINNRSPKNFKNGDIIEERLEVLAEAQKTLKNKNNKNMVDKVSPNTNSKKPESPQAFWESLKVKGNDRNLHSTNNTRPDSSAA